MSELDMMQNQSLIYHPESIIQTQILCLIAAWYFYEMSVPEKEVTSSGDDIIHYDNMMAIMLVEHTCAYLISIFRKYDIS